MPLSDSYRGHKKAYLISAAVLILILGYWVYARRNASDPKYTTAVVRQGDLTSAVQATGTINALTTVPVAPMYPVPCNTYSRTSIRA